MYRPINKNDIIFNMIGIPIGAVGGPLSFVTQPQSKTVDEYSLAAFSCEVTGGVAPYTYQWKKNGTNIGTNSANLSFAAAAADKNASITVVVTDSVGTAITSTVAALGVTSYAFNFDGVTQYIQLSGSGIPVTASTSLIKLSFIGKNVSGNYKKFVESDERNFYIDSGASGTTFRISNCTVKMDGVSISSGTTIPISGKHTLEITPLNSGTIKTISSRGGVDLGNLPLYNFSVLSSGTTVNTIPLNNKSQGANQLATAGSINATIINYNAAGWTAI